ncbi:MAG: ribosomal-processing cysteine protease Prp [Clostridiales bacterium]|jgi:uncharacterized protein YsxB (DUF464 family)|nr:ribosomal-processing cysteine protease Prp [Clostridiales bacterium]OPZ67456.1 MAG: hypothetical protein BWY81_01302 [Firmicutes bacterium ADurb.Bin467]
MTTVRVFRNPDGTISGFDANGHAGYAEAGEDIVCAAVSALTQATLNGLKSVLDAPVEYAIGRKRAHLSVSLAEDFPSDKFEGAQLLLRTLVEGLESLAAAHPRFVRVTNKERR